MKLEQEFPLHVTMNFDAIKIFAQKCAKKFLHENVCEKIPAKMQENFSCTKKNVEKYLSHEN